MLIPNKTSLLIVTVALLSACSTETPERSSGEARVSAAAEKPIYFPKECIVKINLQWPNAMGTKARDEVVRQMAAISNYELTKEIQRPSMAFPKPSNATAYFQYRKNCKEKSQMALEYLNYVEEKIGGRFPVFEVSDEAVEPGPNTILVTGPYWKSEK